MKNVLLLIISLSIFLNVFGTAQIPDLLIYEGDTVSLYSNPLESYYSKNNPRPKDFGISDCYSTACWRGYQATWEIKDQKLYLVEIADCCFWERYLITDEVLKVLEEKIQQKAIEKIEPLKNKEYDAYDFSEKLRKKLGERDFEKYEQIILRASLQTLPKANLEKLFGKHYSEGKVWAFWFFGDLMIPKGELMQYVHMGYMSKYEKELVLSIENGILVETNEYENKSDEGKKGFGMLRANSYLVAVPIELIESKKSFMFTLTDTINFSSTDYKKNIEAYAKLNNERKTSITRKVFVEEIIDSLLIDLNDDYKFMTRKTERLRWGTLCQIDGFNIKTSQRIRVFAMSNINSHLIMYYRETEVDEKKFLNTVNYITASLKLFEFGY